MSTMKALVLEGFGADLALRDLPRPTPQSGQVLVRVAASGVNPLDTKIRAGTAAHAQVTVPAVLGIDLAGTIVELGEGTDTRFDIGDEVYGMTGGVGDHARSISPARRIRRNGRRSISSPARAISARSARTCRAGSCTCTR